MAQYIIKKQMESNLKDKKLLIISSDSKDKGFVENAHDLGVYVIACDRYSDHNISPSKKIADEAWDIDYNNFEEIAKKAKDAGVNGLIAGYGEDRVAAAAKISEILGTPFYATSKQIEFTRDKNAFKNACIKHGIKIPKSFDVNSEKTEIKFPVIIKPSDNGGRKGITICNRPEDFHDAIKYAKENSKNGEVVIEEYIKGIELMAVYTLKDGEYSLSCLNDKYLSEDPDGPTLCDVAMGPSRFLDKFMKEVDPAIKLLLKSINAKNGVANFQFIANEDGIFAFEMGYRVNGNDDWKTIERYNGINNIKMIINFSLTGNMGDDLKKDNPYFPEYATTLCGYIKAGTIGEIEKDGLKNIPNIYDIFFTKQVGSKIPEGHTNAKKTFLIKFTAKSLEQVSETIKKIQDNIKITDVNGNDMLLKKFDTDRLFK